MGRSKNAVSPAGGKSPKNIPKEISGSNNKIENQTKVAAKRLLPDEESDEDINDMEFNQLVNGAPKRKKKKLSMDTGPMDNSMSSDENDDDTEEDEDDLDDSDDSEYDDEKRSPDEPAKTNFSSPTKKGTQKVNEKVSPDSKSKLSVASHESTHSAVSTSDINSASYLLVPHPPNDLAVLKSAISKFGHTVNSIQHTTIPIAIIGVSSKDVKNLTEGSSPVSVHGNQVEFFKIEGSTTAINNLCSLNATRTLFVAGLPKHLSVEQIKSKLPNDCEPTSFKMLTHGPKNKFANAAFLTFDSTSVALEAKRALESSHFGNRTVHVKFVNPIDNTQQFRGVVKTIVACSLPQTVTEAQLKSIFTTAKRFDLINRANELICYMTFETPQAAVDAFDAHNGSDIGTSKLVLRLVADNNKSDPDVTLMVGNLPSEASESDILSVFPGALSAKSIYQGKASVVFPSSDIRRKCMYSPVTLMGKTLRVSCEGGPNRNIAFVKNIPFNATQDDLEKLFPKARVITMHSRPDGKSAGNATVEFPTAELCSQAQTTPKRISSRRLYVVLKDVPLQYGTTPDTKITFKTKPSATKKASGPPQVGSDSESDEVSADIPMNERTLGLQGEDSSEEEETDEDEADEDEDEDDEQDDDEAETDAESSSDEIVQNAPQRKLNNLDKVKPDRGFSRSGFKPRGGRSGDWNDQYRGNNKAGRSRGPFNRGRGNPRGFQRGSHGTHQRGRGRGSRPNRDFRRH